MKPLTPIQIEALNALRFRQRNCRHRVRATGPDEGYCVDCGAHITVGMMT